MQCQVCKKNDATIHLTEINDGIRSELHVCEKCALDQGIAVKSQMPVNELLGNLLSSQPSDEELFGPSTDLECPCCGFTMNHLRKEAQLGCPTDYEVFAEALAPIIKKAHAGNQTHCGKIPSRAPKNAKIEIAISSLQQQLDVAVREENYELAAKLRDKINQKKNKNPRVDQRR